MSYNIDSVEILSQNGFRISKRRWDALARKADAGTLDLPEIHPFDNDRSIEVSDGFVTLKRISFGGEGSGWAEDSLYDILKRFDGSLDGMIVWEGGDSISGFRIKNHKKTSHTVVHSLGEEIT